jgi:hypothetical protein
MKTVLSRLKSFFLKTDFYVALACSVVLYALNFLGLLNVTITLKVWLFVIILASPYTLFFVFRTNYLRKHQKFQLGDLVSIIADERKFVVVRYHYWRPSYAVCKLYNELDAISIHQKYITPYTKIERAPWDMSPLTINHNKHVPTAVIKLL